MKREIFAETISAETIAVLTDEMFKFEKAAKQRSVTANLLKAVPAVAAILIVIGLVNLIPVLNILNTGDNGNEIIPGAAVFEQDFEEDAPADAVLTDIPKIIEKSVFESLLERIPPDATAAGTSGALIRHKFNAYYSLIDINKPNTPDSWELELWELELLVKYPITDKGAFYMFDLNASDREIAEMLGYWNEYIGWSDEDYLEMLDDYLKLSGDVLTIIPRIIEKSVFESLMERISENELALDWFHAFYARIDNSDPLWPRGVEENGIIVIEENGVEEEWIKGLFPYSDKGAFYSFDPRASEREIKMFMSYWNGLIGWTDVEYFKMLEDYGILVF